MKVLHCNRSLIEHLEMRTFLSVSAVEADFYVSPAGSDQNPGTLALPFQTLNRARVAVRAIDGNMTGNINVFLRGGTYNLTQTFNLDQRDSGTNGFNVVWEAYANEQPVISGGETISGWTLHDASKNIWQAPVGSLQIRQLYVNNQRAQLARTTGGLPGKVTATATGYTTTDTSLLNLKRPADLELVYTGGRYAPNGDAWREQILTTTSITAAGSGTAITLRPMAGLPADPAAGIGSPTYLENAYEFLSQPGQWYLDHTAQMLYYIPRAGENMHTAAVVAPVVQTIVQGSGTLNAPVHNIEFSHLAFEYGTWLGPTIAGGFAEDQANFGYSGQRMPANMVFIAAHNIDFEQDLFTHLGGAGLDLYGGSQNNIVNGNVFTDISGSGIQLGNVTTPNPSDPRARDSGNWITNNSISNVADQYHSGIGIFAGYVANTVISHNQVFNLPYSGISLGWGWGRVTTNDMVNNQITDNLVYDVVQLLWDGGGIYTLGAQTNMIIQGNYLHDIPNEGLYEDEGSSFIETSNNVIARVQDWVYVWSPNIHDLNVHNNFTDVSAYVNHGTRTYVTTTTLYSDKSVPAAALKIMNAAGILPNFALPVVL